MFRRMVESIDCYFEQVTAANGPKKAVSVRELSLCRNGQSCPTSLVGATGDGHFLTTSLGYGCSMRQSRWSGRSRSRSFKSSAARRHPNERRQYLGVLPTSFLKPVGENPSVYARSNQELLPRNGHSLEVGIVARISGCQNQKEVSLEDQVDHGKEVMAELYSGPVNYRVVATKGKGERLDRPELAEIEAMLRSGELDFLIMEDIGRLVRGAEAHRLCGIAVDHGVRVLSPNDGVDTDEDTWEEDVLDACKEHVGHNAHTSKRLKQKLMNRFKKFGGATAREIPGYIKPPKEKTDDDTPPKSRTYDEWFKDMSLTGKIQSGAQTLRSTLNCSAVADWFNQNGMPLGKYARGKNKKWDGHAVRRFYSNPILKGFPQRGARRTKKHNESGRRISVPNPKGPSYYPAPHLAHLDPVFFDELNAALKAKNSNHGRKPVNGADPRFRVPRKRTRFPGQFATCWYCGRHYLWGGNGQAHTLMCSGARHWECWNAVSIDGRLLAEKLVTAITSELCRLDGFDSQFQAIVLAAQNGEASDVAGSRARLAQDAEVLRREKENLIAAIKQFGARPMFVEQVDEIERKERALASERAQLEYRRRQQVQLPPSVGELRKSLEDKFLNLTIDSFEFGDLMRQLVSDLSVYVVRLCDGGHPLLRAKVKLNFAGSLSDIDRVPELGQLLNREFTFDLFRPPQRERIREDVIRLMGEGMSQRRIGRNLAEKPKQKVVQDAISLHRKMHELGLMSPYELLLEPPDDYPKLRRHKNPRYLFSMKEGYERQPHST
jgi:site-specific DNA recombinase